MNQSTGMVSILAAFLVLSACRTQQEFVNDYDIVVEEELLDTLVVSAPIFEEDEIENDLPVYRASATRKHDLLHTRLEISFDWSKQYVHGKANLKLKPYFYPSDELVLDAKVFDIHSISMNGKMLEYDYDFSQIKIYLDRAYTRDEEYEIEIKYTAKPNEGPSSGSAAIGSDKGLFFIDPLNQNPNKPQQIWTQGETENSSRWFPTIDKPNERCTQEIYITVEDRFQTLSNGVLLKSIENGDGTRTDYWKQDKAHAPYLFMIGVGEYAVVEDTWEEMPLYYYVEPEFRDHAKLIFNHTPEMLGFFSDKLGYKYPWDKYAQIVCRDYVSGAMENTGAVVFGEFVQKHSREFIDSNNDDIVAHELFHHWFGDLVTCESWSNLSLNEGFATYSEYLWREYKYGKYNAEKKRIQDLNGYLMSAGQGGKHDLIDFKYDDKEQMFDAHSYNKGGLIVHMLRSYVGDDAFFSGLRKYLEDNAYSDVEAHELRLAFEDVTGEDLNWFFNQWFYDQGHPELEINYEISAENKNILIDVMQVQDVESNPSIFRFPVETAVYYENGELSYHKLWMDQREKTFELDINSEQVPAVVVFDGKHDILSVSSEERSEEDYVKLFLLSNEYEDKYNALKNLKGRPGMKKVLNAAVNDPESEIRTIAVSFLDSNEDAAILSRLAQGDSDPAVRAIAIKNLGDPELAGIALERDSSFWVISEALSIVMKNDNTKAIEYADQLSRDYHKPLISKMAEIYANTGDASYLDFFEKNINEVNIYGFFNYINQFNKLVREVDDYDRLVKTAGVLRDLAKDNSNNYFKKYSAANFIRNMISDFRTRQDESELSSQIKSLEEMMQDIVSSSTDKRIKSSFQEYLQP